MPKLRFASRVSLLPQSTFQSPPSGIVSLAAGDAYPEGLPDMLAAAREVLSSFRSEALRYGPRRGLPQLRQWVTDYVRAQGVNITPEHVLIVNGAKHGLDLTCRLFLEPGDSVIVTKPTYQTSLPIFRGYETSFVEVNQDTEGLIVEEIEQQLRELIRAGRRIPKLIYNIPEFHNPTGVTMSRRRRFELVEVAERHGMLVVEDDPYRRIRFEGVPVPPIQSFDRSGCVVGLGTFAKILAPGLRVGWVTAAPEIIERMAAFKSDGGSCPLTQRLILEYSKAGAIERHIEAVTRIYAGHRDATLEALARHLPGATVVKPQGSYYLWVRLPEHVDSDKLLSAALRHGVEFLPAGVFYANGGPSNYLRLAYSNPSLDAIAEGMRRLGMAWAEVAGPQESRYNGPTTTRVGLSAESGRSPAT